MDPFGKIQESVPQAELLALLAEEAVELAHAALKLRRVYDGTNPTPVKGATAFANLKEELADVWLVVSVLGYDRHRPEIVRIQSEKLKRWLQRLEEEVPT